MASTIKNDTAPCDLGVSPEVKQDSEEVTARASSNQTSPSPSKRPPRRVRVLRALHVIPKDTAKDVTRAEVGLQTTGEPCVLEEAELSRLRETSESYNRVRGELNETREQLAKMETENENFKEKLLRLEQDLNSANHDKQNQGAYLSEKLVKVQENLDAATGREESLLNKVAFLEEENEYKAKNLADCQKELEITSAELDIKVTELKELKAVYLQSKLKSSEIIGQYIDELQESIEEKEEILSSIDSDSWALNKALESTRRTYSLHKDRNLLVDEVQILSTKLTAQKIEMDNLREDLSVVASLAEKVVSDSSSGRISPVLRVAEDGSTSLIFPETPTYEEDQTPKDVKKESFIEMFYESAESVSEVQKPHNCRASSQDEYLLRKHLIELRELGRTKSDTREIRDKTVTKGKSSPSLCSPANTSAPCNQFTPTDVPGENPGTNERVSQSKEAMTQKLNLHGSNGEDFICA